MAGPWEKRWHPLLGQWVIIASTSAARPWSGATIDAETSVAPAHDEKCYLCPRVQRAAGSTNPDYRGPFAFDNDFPSLSFEAPETADKNSNNESGNQDDLIHYSPAHGRCRVLCWSHRHDATLATVSESNMIEVAQLWQQEFTELSQDSRIAQVSIFENKGTEIGVSNLHPHGQIYATDFVTDTVRKMRNAQAAYPKGQSQPSLLGALVHQANQSKDLIVERSEHCTVLVPGCARFSFETWIVPHRQATSIAALTSEELCDFALVYQRQVKRRVQTSFEVHR